jgi:tetratricopeptide (TPR) repeat protein
MVRKIPLILLVLYGVLFWQMGARCFASTIGKADGLRAEREYVQAEAIYKQIIGDSNDIKQVLQAQKRLTILYIESNNEPRAKEAFEELVAKFAGHEGVEEVVFELGEEYGEVKKYDRAREVYQYVVDHWPQTGEAIEAQEAVVRSSILLEDDAAAEAATDSLIGKFSGDDDIVSVLNDVADAYLRRQKMEKADQIYRRVLQTWPEHEDAIWSQTELAKSRIALGDDPNADIAVSKVLRDFGQNEGIGQAAGELAAEYAATGKYEKACDLYRYVVDNRTEDGEALDAQMQLTMLRIRLWDLDGAEAELGKLLSQFSQDDDLADAVHEIVEEYRNTGAHEESRELFNYLLKEWAGGKGTMLELQVGVALQSVKLREPNMVDAAVAKLIADYNDHPRIAKGLFQIGEQCFYALDYKRCARLLELIRSKYPDHRFPSKPELPYIAAYCYERMHLYDEAVENYGRCVEEYPGGRFSSGAAYRAGVVCMAKTKDYEQAVYWFDQQRRLYPNSRQDSGAIYRSAECYSRLEDYTGAAEAYEEYIDKFPSGLNVWASYAGLADSHAKLGYTGQALAILQTAYEKAGTDSLRTEFTAYINALSEGGAQ